MKTTQTREEKSDILEYPFSSLDDEGSPKLQFEIRGLTNERSYEDRDVYLRVGMNTPEQVVEQCDPEPSVSMEGMTVEYTSTVQPIQPDFQMWMRGEDAIDLGVKLIEHGKFALESNMINHQAIHTFNRFRRYLEEECIEEVNFKVIDENPPNYGDGFRTYLITPTWKEGMEPEYDSDFMFERVIYWSPFPAEYADQLDAYTLGTSYSFEGYDREAELRAFNESVRLMSGNDV